MMRMVVPPGGFAGAAQQTPATLALWSNGRAKRNGANGGRRSAAKRRKARATSSTSSRSSNKRRRSSSKRPARLVKGSPAAKRYMASIRKRRKRK